MSRRAQRPELEFGSDSFLDVVCNIVGILIILIVIVAVKVERQPKADATTETDSEARTAKASEQELRLRAEQQSLQNLITEEQSLLKQRTVLETEKDELTQELQRADQEMQQVRLQQTETQNRSVRRHEQRADAEKEKQTISARVASLRQSLTTSSDQEKEASSALVSVRTSEETLDRRLQTTVLETQRLQEVLTKTAQVSVATDRLQHRLSPVTKPVESGEMHFRVSQGRISAIPLEELLERWKSQVLSRRSTMMRFNQIEGRVGPVNGYFMDYVVEKEGPSTLEALRNGETTTRVTMSRWTLTVDSSLVDESVSDAVRPGSRFRQMIETAPPDSVITIWIYAESFESFAPLREVAHGLQLRVAARPLPDGTPIVGSPNGSKSTAQ